ncbi:MAG: hydroxyacylglutathione hydrolase [Alphaproteobacteria bacterium]|nr:hydroxyacylglutathione hydrolase [Alphaproteobacteria bacterium]
MHAVTRPRDPFPVAHGLLEVHQIPVASDNLVWLLVSHARGEAAVVDGPPDAGPVLALCERLGVALTTVLNTHTHWDHIGVNQDLEKRGLLAGMRVVGAAAKRAEVPGITEAVGEGDTFELFGVPVRVMLTEGHIDGHVSYVVDGAVFCGDTLFAGGCGYLFDGPPAKMARSLQRLCELPGDTLVCCAHEYTEDNLRFAWMVEPDNAALAERIRRVWAIRADGGCSVPSTIEEERATNPFVRGGSPTLVAKVRELGSLASDDYVTVFAATRALKDAKRHREVELHLPLS